MRALTALFVLLWVETCFCFSGLPASGFMMVPFSSSRLTQQDPAFSTPKVTNILFCGPRSGVSKWRCQASTEEEQPKSLLTVFCPLLKLFANPDPTAPRNKFLETASTGFASIARLPWGAEVSPLAASRDNRPEQPIRLYEFEACPFCRRVRELATFLDLELEVYPCPKGSTRNRNEVVGAGGKELFPFLHDLNTGAMLYESADIVKYLLNTYGEGAELPPLLLESTLITGWMPTLLRGGRGIGRWEGACAEAPEQLLTLYSYENNQFCRLVREVLCELELPYRLVSTGKGSIAGREELQKVTGRTRAPVLVDRNEGVTVTDSADIMQHLFKHYCN